jgi:hypothetical protein
LFFVALLILGSQVHPFTAGGTLADYRQQHQCLRHEINLLLSLRMKAKTQRGKVDPLAVDSNPVPDIGAKSPRCNHLITTLRIFKSNTY